MCGVCGVVCVVERGVWCGVRGVVCGVCVHIVFLYCVSCMSVCILCMCVYVLTTYFVVLASISYNEHRMFTALLHCSPFVDPSLEML